MSGRLRKLAIGLSVMLAASVLGSYARHSYLTEQKKSVEMQQAKWKSYVASAQSKGQIAETRWGEEMQIPDHPGYLYKGAATSSDYNGNDYEFIRISAPEKHYNGGYDYNNFYFDNCGTLALDQQGNESVPFSFYGKASEGNQPSYRRCFLSDKLLVVSANSSVIRYVVDLAALKATDELMDVDHFTDYTTGTVIGVGGTLPALLKSRITLHSDFGKGMSADVSGDTVRIGDPTLVLRVKSSDVIYTIQVVGEDGEGRQQSMANLASAITNSTKISFPVHLHIYAEPNLREVFSSNKIGRLDAEYIDIKPET
jgi:hypothetical protein